jgi:hypothetical protein
MKKCLSRSAVASLIDELAMGCLPHRDLGKPGVGAVADWRATGKLRAKAGSRRERVAEGDDPTEICLGRRHEE